MFVTRVVLISLFASSTAALAVPSKPLTIAHKKQISTAVKALLKDPNSAQFRWTKLRDFGVYCGWVNAKNSFGGYTGFEPFLVVGGVGNGPKSDGSFLIVDTKLGSGDYREIVDSMCAKEGFDMSGPPSE